MAGEGPGLFFYIIKKLAKAPSLKVIVLENVGHIISKPFNKKVNFCCADSTLMAWTPMENPAKSQQRFTATCGLPLDAPTNLPVEG